MKKQKEDLISNLYLKGKYMTDKYDLGYLENLYDNIFLPYKDKDINLLEIGCGSGGSIKLWSDYFSKANIYGVDINNYPTTNPKIHKIVGDAYSEETFNKFKDNFFDFIIDDGPHTYESFLKVIPQYYFKLKPKGLLIIEDILRPTQNIGVTEQQQSYLKELSHNVGYSSSKEYSMYEKQKTPYLLNRWKSGLYILVLTK